MNADNRDGTNLENSDNGDALDVKNADNSDNKDLKSADNSDSEVLVNAANNDGKDHHQNADENDGKDLNDGRVHLQNTDNVDGKEHLWNGDDNGGKVHLQNADKNYGEYLNDGKDHLQDADKNDDIDLNGGKDYLQNADNDDGKEHLHIGDYNGGNEILIADKDDDKDLVDGMNHLQYTDDNDGSVLQGANYNDDEDLLIPDNNDGDYPMFEQMYRCYPVSYIDKAHLENGDKVLMPPSALQQLAYSEIDFPILFELSNPSSGKVTHCGVLEFTANEGTIVLPAWMMEFMQIKEGDFGRVKYTSLLKGTYVKLQPHTMDFLALSNPKAVLERVLRSYSCLTIGGTVVLPYNDKKYYVDIVETKPSAAICIIETDCEVDFAPPLDYKEPEKSEVDEEPEKKKLKVGPFTGLGRRLDGKPSAQQVEKVSSPALKQHQADNGIGSTTAKQSGTLVFGNRKKEKAQDSANMEEEKKFKAFSGKMYLLKDNAR